MRLLSLCDRDILLLVSNSVLVHLRYTGKEQKPKIVSCVCLELDPEAAERISDVCLSHEILFLLDSLGFICILPTGLIVVCPGRLYLLCKINVL